MATVYRAPDGFRPPAWADSLVDGKYSRTLDDRLQRVYIEQLAKLARRQHKGDLVGSVIRFQIADGYARYMVWNHRPLQLVHLDLDDGYTISAAHMRGLRLADVRELVEHERRIAALFSKTI